MKRIHSNIKTIDVSGGALVVSKGFRFAFDLFERYQAFFRDERADNVLYASSVDFPLFNGCYGSSFTHQTDEQIERRIDESLAVFKKNGVSAFWWIEPTTFPAHLGQLLEQRGLVPQKPSSGMVCQLDHWKPAGKTASNISVQAVQSVSEFEIWNQVFCEAFALPEFVKRTYFESLLAIGLNEPKTVQYFIAFFDGRAVGCAQLILGNGVAGLWGVGTLEHARKNGVGQALTEHCLIEAKRLNYQTAMLTASETGFSLYRKIGFARSASIPGFFLSRAKQVLNLKFCDNKYLLSN